ncbi:hypothetical protein GCM10027443_28660 [Pontibacter brevis]
MNAFSILFFLLLACSFHTQAQEADPQFFPPTTQYVQITDKEARPLVIVDSQETRHDALILDPNKIQRVDVYKGEKTVDKFGAKGKEGVVLVSLKEEVALSRLPEIFDRFDISKQARKLTVAIDGKHVSEPELLLADLRQIKKVEVKPFDVTAPSRWTFEEEYLNIVTVQ